MRNTCEICNEKCYGKRCFRHKIRKPIQKTALKKTGVKKRASKVPTKEGLAKKPVDRGRKAHVQRKKSFRAIRSRLWTIFSKYIRLRDADEHGFCICFTSGRRIFWKMAEAGHFMPTRHTATWIHEKNVHAQSHEANQHNQGEQFVYGKRLDAIYGDGTAEYLAELAQTYKKYTIEEMEKLTTHYKKEVALLLKAKSL